MIKEKNKRIIKFRAWDAEMKIMSHDIQNNLGFYLGHNYTIMQYTGMKDKNRKEIYEGDIVEYKGREGIKSYIVKYEYCGFSFVEVGHENCSAAFPTDKSKIVGNIYENPELIKKMRP